MAVVGDVTVLLRARTDQLQADLNEAELQKFVELARHQR